MLFRSYFEDPDYQEFLTQISILSQDKERFRQKYIEVNHLEDLFSDDLNLYLKRKFYLIKDNNKDMSLDQILYTLYKGRNFDESFEDIKKKTLAAVEIDELNYYLNGVNTALIAYVEKEIFPQYKDNDQAHGIIHILEVIRRAFALNETLKLGLNKDMIYAIAAYHDLGKYINHEIHEKIAADIFINDENMKQFFTDEERVIIKEAIEDHRSSKSDTPRTTYGKLISSADRNTKIEIVFIRSFFVAQVRQPDSLIEDYLDYTFKRLSKRYSEENPENMFYEDEAYHTFLIDMRKLLNNEEEFKKLYCKINHITDRTKKVSDFTGEVQYLKLYRKED